jgi:hypothetical protein
LLPEPGAPGGTEYLPFIQIGTGAGPLDGLLPFADSIVGHDAPTAEVARFARAAAGDRVGVDAVKAVYAAVMERVKGEESDIHERAASTLARERGSRLWLLKGALRALGISSRVALVRPLSSDPGHFEFPNADLYVYPVLVVHPPAVAGADGAAAATSSVASPNPAGAGLIWLDPSARFAPFGELPDVVAGEREAVVLPEPGDAIEQVKTPAAPPLRPKQVKLHLSLNAQGDVTGIGSEVYQGFEAAYLRQALERLDEPQRKQAVEVALSRTFRGAALSKLSLQAEPGVGAPLSFEYTFTSPRFGRPDGNRMVLATPLFPLGLGQRYVSMATRSLPLLIPATESADSEFQVDLPPGFTVQSSGQPVSIATRFGAYSRSVRVEKSQLIIRESAVLHPGRIPPDQYPEFIKFAASVDQAQTQDIDLVQGS